MTFSTTPAPAGISIFVNPTAPYIERKATGQHLNTVQAGDQVVQGQRIAAIGASGSANIPYLHYELRNGDHIRRVEELPSYFRSFRRYVGVTPEVVAIGGVDIGDIVERA